MLRKTILQCSNSSALNWQHTNYSSHCQRILVSNGGYRDYFRAASSLPLHSNHNYVPHPSRRESDDDDYKRNNSTLQRQQHAPFLFNNHKPYCTAASASTLPYKQYHDTTTLRQYHATPSIQRGGPAIALTLGAVAATAKAGQYVVQGYQEWKAAADAEEENRRAELKARGVDPDKEESENGTADDSKGEDTSSSNSSSNNSGAKTEDGGANEKNEGKRENIFAKFFNMSVGSKYYEGEFVGVDVLY